MTRHALHIAFALLAALLLASSASAYVGSSQSLNATLLYYEPVPAEPGGVVDVFVQVTNTGGTSGRISVEFVDTFPFSIDSESDRVKTVPSIPSQESFLVKYRVRIADNAPSGPNPIKIQYYTDTATRQTALLTIDVLSSDVALVVENVRVTPETIIPGETGTITVTVRNGARLTITDGYLHLALNGLDIIPYGTTDQQPIAGIAGGTSRELRFGIIPGPNLEPGIYQVPLIANFTDAQGTRRLIVQTIGLRIGAVPLVSVSLDDVVAGTDAGTSDLNVRVTNKGLGEIKFVTLTMGEQEGYSISSGGVERYVGNIDSDDYKTARVPVSITQDEVSIPVTISYADAFNQRHEQQVTLVARAPNVKSGISTTLIVVIVLVVVLGAWLFLRRRGKNR